MRSRHHRKPERLADIEGLDFARVIIEHAYRGVRVHLLLRGVLVALFVLVVTAVPPRHDRGWCVLITVIYAAWALVVMWLASQGGDWFIRFIWLALFVDLLMLSAITVVAGQSAVESWTADVLVNGFFLLPVIAATQIRPWVCAAVGVPTVLVYLTVSIITRSANAEPWGSVLVRTVVVAGVALGCVLISRLSRSRVLTIGGLVSDRSELLGALMTIEGREQRNLAEALHDGALQYVLAARQDLEDLQGRDDPQAFERIDFALRESSQLLRSAVSELNPAVLEHSGLLVAVRDLAAAAGARGGFEAVVDAPGWDDSMRTSADPLLFASARELLTNVVKHAGAKHVRVQLDLEGDRAMLQVADDGRGIAAGELAQRLGEGHIGVETRRVRLEAAGGSLTFRAAQPTGTVAEVQLPVVVADDAVRGNGSLDVDRRSSADAD